MIIKKEDIKDFQKVKNEVEQKKTSELVPKMRQIIISTDGNNIKIEKAEVLGRIEFIAILQNLISFINKQK